MPDPVDIRALIGLPPEETARAFEARDELRPTVRWSEMFHDDHARAFTVAKVAKLDLLETIRVSLERVLKEGGTFEQWQAQIRPELERAGWWGRVQDKSLTGTSRPVLVGPRRLRTIYSTNLRVSRAAGQWARIQELKDVAPYLRYSAVMDGRTRPLHRAWHGTILAVDHPWWETHFPPCGWNCRCTVIQLSDRDLRRNGWLVTKNPPRSGPPRSFWRAGADRPEAVPAGIDPGWAYHPGKASMRAIAAKAAATIEEIAKRDVDEALTILRGFARRRTVDFAATFGEAGAESAEDVRGFSRQLAVSEVRHIYLFHGAGGRRAPAFPVTDEDLILIPRVVAEGRRHRQSRRAGETQVFVLEIDGLYYVYAERIGRKHRRLMGRTFYKTDRRPAFDR